MKNRLAFAGCLLVALALTACQGDEEGKYHFENRVFIPGNSFTEDLFIKRDNLDVTRSERCRLVVGMAQPEARNLQIRFRAAPELLDRYRLFYEDPDVRLLPADGGYYAFSELTATIPAGAVESAPLDVVFEHLDRLPVDDNRRYVLPVTIDTSDGMAVLESARTVYFRFSKAALVNVVADLQNNCAWPEWTDRTEAVRDMETFTLEALIYANSFDRPISTILGIEDCFLIRLGDSGPANQLQVAFAGKVSPEAASVSRGTIPASPDSRFDLKPFRWYHIAVTFDHGTVAVYIDGKLRISTRAELSSPEGKTVAVDRVNFAVPHSDETDGRPRCFWIGHSYRLKSDGDLFYERRFDGRISEVRIWNRALAADELTAENHFYKIDPASDGLVAYWKFDDRTTGRTVRDYGPNGFTLTSEREIDWQPVALPEP